MTSACDNINDKWDCFHKTIEDGANLFVPVKRKSAAKNKIQWMTKELKNIVKKKTKAWNIYFGAKLFSNWTLYKICNSVTNAVTIAGINVEYKLVDDMRDEGKCGRFKNLQKWYLCKDQCEQSQYSKEFFCQDFH